MLWKSRYQYQFQCQKMSPDYVTTVIWFCPVLHIQNSEKTTRRVWICTTLGMQSSGLFLGQQIFGQVGFQSSGTFLGLLGFHINGLSEQWAVPSCSILSAGSSEFLVVMTRLQEVTETDLCLQKVSKERQCKRQRTWNCLLLLPSFPVWLIGAESLSGYLYNSQEQETQNNEIYSDSQYNEMNCGPWCHCLDKKYQTDGQKTKRVDSLVYADKHKHTHP